MIIVLYANTGESLKKAFSYIEHQHAGLSDHVNLSRIGDIELRIAQLNQIPDGGGCVPPIRGTFTTLHD